MELPLRRHPTDGIEIDERIAALIQPFRRVRQFTLDSRW